MSTTVIKIVDPTGNGDYLNLHEWHNSEQKDLVAADEIHIVECRSGGNLIAAASGTLTITNGQWTTDKNHYIEMRAAEGHEHEGVWDTSKAYAEVSNDEIIQIAANTNNLYLKFRKLQFHYAGTGGANGLDLGSAGNGLAANTQIVIDRCILRSTNTSTLTAPLEITGGGGTFPHIIKNNFIIDNNPTASNRLALSFDDGSPEVNSKVYNNTIIASGGTAMRYISITTAADQQINNNYFAASTIFTGNISLGDGDATSDGTAPTAGLQNVPYDNTIFTSNALNNEDLHLVDSASNPLLKNGADLSTDDTDPDGPVLVDIDGDSRVPGGSGQGGPGIYDIGGDQIVNVEGPIFLGGFTSGITVGLDSAFIGGYILAGGVPAGRFDFGGYLLALAEEGNNNFAILGGYQIGDGGQITGHLGCYLNAFPTTAAGTVFIGGLASGANTDQASVGGWAIARPDYSEFTETHARALVKATDTDTPGQKLEVDGIVIFKARDNEEFNSLLRVIQTTKSEFNAKLIVGKYKLPPSVTITQVASSGNGVLGQDNCITVTASGQLRDGYEWTHGYIDFGEPVGPNGLYLRNASISGFTGPPPWTASHCYSSSGIYHIVARGTDNFGLVGSDLYEFNIASGLIQGVDYPVFAISGVPRLGEVPPSLSVDFTLTSSGSLGVRSPTDTRLHWNLGNRERSQKKNPSTKYSSPGDYVPIARLRYVSPNGDVIWSSDSLRLGVRF